MSFGVTSPILGAEITKKEFVKRADKALYKAKAKGKNMVCVYQAKSECAHV